MLIEPSKLIFSSAFSVLRPERDGQESHVRGEGSDGEEHHEQVKDGLDHKAQIRIPGVFVVILRVQVI